MSRPETPSTPPAATPTSASTPLPSAGPPGPPSSSPPCSSASASAAATTATAVAAGAAGARAPAPAVPTNRAAAASRTTTRRVSLPRRYSYTCNSNDDDDNGKTGRPGLGLLHCNLRRLLGMSNRWHKGEGWQNEAIDEDGATYDRTNVMGSGRNGMRNRMACAEISRTSGAVVIIHQALDLRSGHGGAQCASESGDVNPCKDTISLSYLSKLVRLPSH